MRHPLRFLFSALLACSLPFGCTGTETGNPDIVQVRLALTSSEDSRIAISDGYDGSASDGADWAVEGGRVRVEALRFTPCDGASEYATSSAFTPDGELVELEAGSYCGLTITLNSDSSTGLGGATSASSNTVWLTGRRSDQSLLAMQFGADVEFELALPSGTSGAELLAGKEYLLSLDLAIAVRDGLTVDLASVSGDAVVSDTQNVAARDEIVALIPSSVSLLDPAAGSNGEDTVLLQPAP